MGLFQKFLQPKCFMQNRIYIFCCKMWVLCSSKSMRLQFLRELKLYIKLVPEKVRQPFTSKLICNHLFMTIICKSTFTTGILHWTTVSSANSISGVTISENAPNTSILYLICLTYCFPFSLSSRNIWHRLFYFVITLLAAALFALKCSNCSN